MIFNKTLIRPKINILNLNLALATKNNVILEF